VQLVKAENRKVVLPALVSAIAAASALTIAGGRCQLLEPLPPNPATRGALLDRPARGEVPVPGSGAGTC
jgi:hypothetical protein